MARARWLVLAALVALLAFHVPRTSNAYGQGDDDDDYGQNDLQWCLSEATPCLRGEYRRECWNEYYEGECVPCTNALFCGVYLNHTEEYNLLSNDCPWECDMEVCEPRQDIHACVIREAPVVLIRVQINDNSVDNLLDDDFRVDKGTPRAYVHTGGEAQFGDAPSSPMAEVHFHTYDNSLGCNAFVTAPPYSASTVTINETLPDCHTQGYSYFGTIGDMENEDEDNDFYPIAAGDCAPITLTAVDFGVPHMEGVQTIEVCAFSAGPQVTLELSSQGLEIDLNKKTVSHMTGEELPWSPDATNTGTNVALISYTREPTVAFTATDPHVPIRPWVYCSQNTNAGDGEWGTETVGNPDSSQLVDTSTIDEIYRTRVFGFTPASYVTELGWDMDNVDWNSDTNTISGELGVQCGLEDLSDGVNDIHFAAKNKAYGIASITTETLTFVVCDNPSGMAYWSGGGALQTDSAGNDVGIYFEAGNGFQLMTTSGHPHFGKHVVANVRPTIVFEARYTCIPIKKRMCKVVGVMTQYDDCSPFSDPQGSWTPGVDLPQGLNTFEMKVEDWDGNWVSVQKDFVVDTMGISVEFTADQIGVTYDNDITLQFQASEDYADFQWRYTRIFDTLGSAVQSESYGWYTIQYNPDLRFILENGAHVTRAQARMYRSGGLKFGKWRFEVRAIDYSNNVGEILQQEFEVSPQVSISVADRSRRYVVRRLLSESEPLEEHCNNFENCVKVIEFFTEYASGNGDLHADIYEDYPPWISVTTTEISSQNKFRHRVHMDISQIDFTPDPDQKSFSHTLKVQHVDKLCTVSPLMLPGMIACSEGLPFSNDDTNVAIGSHIRVPVSLTMIDAPTIDIQPPDLLRSGYGGLEIDITRSVNQTLTFSNDGDLPTYFKFGFESASDASETTDECGSAFTADQLMYLNQWPPFISVSSPDGETFEATEEHTIAAKGYTQLVLTFDNSQLKTERYRIAFVVQSNEYSLLEDPKMDEEDGYAPSMADYEYNGCGWEDSVWACNGNSFPQCVDYASDSWTYIQDRGGLVCGLSSANMQPVALSDRIDENNLGIRMYAIDIEGKGANTLLMFPSELPKKYIAAGTETSMNLIITSMVGVCDVYFVYDVSRARPTIEDPEAYIRDGAFKPWVTLFLDLEEPMRTGVLEQYEQLTWLDFDTGTVDLEALNASIVSGDYPDILSGTSDNGTAFKALMENWIQEADEPASRFKLDGSYAQVTDIQNSNGQEGLTFATPLEVEVRLSYLEQYGYPITEDEIDCLIGGTPREFCLEQYSMDYIIENSVDHYFGAWPYEVGQCAYGVCNSENVKEYDPTRLKRITVSAEMEPGMCSAQTSSLALSGGSVAGSDYTFVIVAGEELNLTIQTRDALGNARFPPSFCLSSAECRNPCSYTPTRDELFLGYGSAIYFAAGTSYDDWSEFKYQPSDRIFSSTTALTSYSRRMLFSLCDGNPMVDALDTKPLGYYDNFGDDDDDDDDDDWLEDVAKRSEMLTLTPLRDYAGRDNPNTSYILFETYMPDNRYRCWDARALKAWMMQPESRYKGGYVYPLDAHTVMTDADVELIEVTSGGQPMPSFLMSEVPSDLLGVDPISDYKYSTDLENGKHSINFRMMRSGVHNVEVGAVDTLFQSRPPTHTPGMFGMEPEDGSVTFKSTTRRGCEDGDSDSNDDSGLGVPEGANDDSISLLDGGVLSIPCTPIISVPISLSLGGVSALSVTVIPAAVDITASVVKGSNPLIRNDYNRLCLEVEPRDRFDNQIVTIPQDSVEARFHMLFERGFKGPLSFVQSEASYDENSEDDVGWSMLEQNDDMVMYRPCFDLTTAGHYSLWMSERSTFADSTEENVKDVLIRGGEGVSAQMNRDMTFDLDVRPGNPSSTQCCLSNAGDDFQDCGEDPDLAANVVGHIRAGETFTVKVHSYDMHMNALHSSEGYTFEAKVMGNTTDAPFSTVVAQVEAHPVFGDSGVDLEGSCRDTYFQDGYGGDVLVEDLEDRACQNEFLLIFDTDDSDLWFGTLHNGTYSVSIDMITYNGNGQEVGTAPLLSGVTLIVTPSNILSANLSELYAGIPAWFVQNDDSRKLATGEDDDNGVRPFTAYSGDEPLPMYRFNEEYVNIYLMPKDKYGNFLHLPMESNVLPTGVPLSPAVAEVYLYDESREGALLSSTWSFKAVYDAAGSLKLGAVRLMLDFSPAKNGTYNMEIKMSEGTDEVAIFGNPFSLTVQDIICEEGSEAERFTGSYCVCTAGWYDLLTSALGDLPDCERCGITQTGRLEQTQYNEKPDQFECETCPQCADGKTFEFADIGSTSPYDCRCPDGFVRIPHLTGEDYPLTEFGTHQCHPCPEGALCLNGTDLANIEAIPGYWRPSNATDTFVDCASTIAGSEICAGGLFEGENYCQAGHTGPLCVLCDEGWETAAFGECIQCKTGKNQALIDWLQIVGTVLAIVLVVSVFVRREIRSMKAKIMKGDITEGRARTQLLKSFLSYLQIVGIAKQVQVEWNPLLQKYFSTVNSIASDFAVQSQAFTCQLPTNYTQKWRAYMAAPILASVALYVLFFLKHQVRRCTNPTGAAGKGKIAKDWTASYITTLLVLIFLLYPTIVKKSVEVFGCRNFVSSKVSADGSTTVDEPISLLSVDNSISCLSADYKSLRLQAMIAIALYGIGVPFLLYTAMKRRRSTFHEKGTMLMFGFMYFGYKDQFWWWECMTLIRKLFMALILVFFSENLYIQLFLSLVVCQIFLLLQLRFKPFDSSVCNFFESFSLFTLWFTLQGTFLYFTGVTLTVNLAITACLAMANFGVCLFFFMMYFFQTLNDKADTLRGPLSKVGIDIDWVLRVLKDMSKAATEIRIPFPSTAGPTKGDGTGGGNPVFVGLTGDETQAEKIQAMGNILENLDLSHASEDEVLLIEGIKMKLINMLLNRGKDGELPADISDSVFDGIAEYLAKYSGRSGTIVNPLADHTSLGEGGRQRERTRTGGQSTWWNGLTNFFGRIRSETGNNYLNPLADEKSSEAVRYYGQFTKLDEPGEFNTTYATLSDHTGAAIGMPSVLNKAGSLSDTVGPEEAKLRHLASTDLNRTRAKTVLKTIDAELETILNWRNEITEKGEYVPLSSEGGGAQTNMRSNPIASKVKHVHRDSIHPDAIVISPQIQPKVQFKPNGGDGMAGEGQNTTANPLAGDGEEETSVDDDLPTNYTISPNIALPSSSSQQRNHPAFSVIAEEGEEEEAMDVEQGGMTPPDADAPGAGSVSEGAADAAATEETGGEGAMGSGQAEDADSMAEARHIFSNPILADSSKPKILKTLPTALTLKPSSSTAATAATAAVRWKKKGKKKKKKDKK